MASHKKIVQKIYNLLNNLVISLHLIFSMIAQLFKQLYRMILQPAMAWKVLADEKKEETTEDDSFFKTYLYPVIGIVAILTFTGVFFHRKEFSVELALRLTIKVSIALFAGFYMASFFLSKLMERFFSTVNNEKLCQGFVGYSSALVYVVYMILAIFPGFGFLQLILLYTVYIIWEGATVYMQITESERNKFTAAATAIILLSPFIIEKIMLFTMPGMRS